MDLEFGVYTDYKGYEDYNEVLETSYDNDIITPRRVVVQMLNLLPDDVWNSRTTFLNIACKNGIFLQFILNRLMRELESEIPDANMRKQHILNNQLYGIATNEITALVSNRRIYDEVLKPTNIKYIGALDRYNIKNYENKVKKEFGEDMKFDVIIGNPPYQQAIASIYQYFIDASIDLKPNHIIMVVKNNWMKSDTLKITRDRMIDYGLAKIINYPIYNEVFECIDTPVNIFYINNKSTSQFNFKEVRKGRVISEYRCNIKGYPIILNSVMENNILGKIIKDLTKGSFRDRVLPTEPFRITSNFNIGRGKNKYKLDYKDKKDDYYNIKVAYTDGSNNIRYVYTNSGNIPNRTELIDKYKILSGGRLNRNKIVVTNINIIDKMSVCTSTWAVLYHSENKEEIDNVYCYIKTRFFRFLVRLLCDDGLINISPYRFSLVPIQDFSKRWSDDELYKKYNLSEDEIEYIKSKVDLID